MFFKDLLVVFSEVLRAKVHENTDFLREVAVGWIEDEESCLSRDMVLQSGE